MRAVVQRVVESRVIVDGIVVGQIRKGLMILLGISNRDTVEDIKYMTEKIVNLRVFEDCDEKMNLSVLDVLGELLVVSQFTLYGDCRKGRRPSFIEAARPEMAKELYEKFVEECRALGVKTATGTFQADMKVEIVNDGPVTLILDSERIF